MLSYATVLQVTMPTEAVHRVWASLFLSVLCIDNFCVSVFLEILELPFVFSLPIADDVF